MASTKKDETRQRLLDVARMLFLARGFHGVSLEDIAEAAGVSRQAIYKSHFSSKADLVLALARHVHVVEKLDELIQPALAATDAVEKLEASIRAVIQIHGKLHDLSIVLSTAARTDPGAAAAWAERMHAQRAGLRVAVQLLSDEGLLDPRWGIDEVVDMLSSFLSVDTYQMLVVERGWTPELLVTRLCTISRETFLVTPSGKPNRKTLG